MLTTKHEISKLPEVKVKLCTFWGARFCLLKSAQHIKLTTSTRKPGPLHQRHHLTVHVEGGQYLFPPEAPLTLPVHFMPISYKVHWIQFTYCQYETPYIYVVLRL